MPKALKGFLSRLAAPLTGNKEEQRDEKPRLKKRKNTEPENRKD